MTRQDSPRQFDAREDGKGDVATGHERGMPRRGIGDSLTESSVSGLVVPKPLPDGVEGEDPSEMRTKDNDSGKRDGVAELKRMEQNAEDGRE